MQRKVLFNKILIFALVIVVICTSTSQSIFAKYTKNYSGLASHTWFTTKVITDTFRLTNSDFIGADEVTSENLHGLFEGNINLSDQNATYTIPQNADHASNSLDTLENKVFVVQNTSDYDLVACFDIVVCLGWAGSGNPQLNCTITAEGTNPLVELEVTASKDGTAPTGAALKSHKENANDTGDLPIIDVQYTGILGNWTPYRAYSTHIDPTVYRGTSLLSVEDFDAFILIRSGESKTFMLSVEPTGVDIGNLDRNAYASMTMTVKKWDGSTT